MKYLQLTFVIIVSLLHFYFMVLEMFYWDKPIGLKAFGLKLEEARTSKTLAKNQGLYNGFLASGLIWSIFSTNHIHEIAIFFFSCITIAGIYGAYTTNNNRIFLIQSLPAIIGLILTLLIS